MTQITESQMKRTKDEWEKIAGESLQLESMSGLISDPIYAYGSELAVLRLFYKFAGSAKAAYSKNLQTWYFINK
jgi:hypothetical protein